MIFYVLKDGDGLIEVATSQSDMLETFSRLEKDQQNLYGFHTLSMEEVDLTKMSEKDKDLFIINIICNNPKIGLFYNFRNNGITTNVNWLS